MTYGVGINCGAPAAAALCRLQKGRRDIAILSADHTRNFSAGPLPRMGKSIGLLWVFLCVAAGAQDFDIRGVMTLFFVLCPWLLVVSVQMVLRATSFTVPNFLDAMSNYFSGFVGSIRYSALPVWMGISSEFESSRYRKTLHATVFARSTSSLSYLKVLSASLACAVDHGFWLSCFDRVRATFGASMRLAASIPKMSVGTSKEFIAIGAFQRRTASFGEVHG